MLLYTTPIKKVNLFNALLYFLGAKSGRGEAWTHQSSSEDEEAEENEESEENELEMLLSP